MIYDTDLVQTIFRNHSQSHPKVLVILEGKIPLLIVTMDIPLSSEDIEQALRGVHEFCVVSSYDLLSNLEHGQFIFINTDNVLPTVYDRVEGGHQMLTVCREIDHALVFDTFDRSLEQIEKTIPNPISNVSSLMHFQTAGYSLTRKFYRIQVRRFVDVMRFWSDDCFPITNLSKEYSNISERCFQTMCWKMIE